MYRCDITLQDFQKRQAIVDKSITTILDCAIKKILYYENIETKKALKKSEIDETAVALMDDLLQGVSFDKRLHYKDVLLPHINSLIKAIKEMKTKPKDTPE